MPKGFSGLDFRDPKIWKEDGIYYCVVSAKNERGLGSILLFASNNLIDWEYKNILFENNGDYGKMWECPDFFKLNDKYILVVSVMEMQAKGREYFNGHQVLYFIGDYYKKNYRFEPTDNARTLDFGFDCYAPQSLSINERTLSVAWLHDWGNDLTPDGAKWCGQMTYPRELELKKDIIYQMPAKELEKHYTNEYKTSFCLEKDYKFQDTELNSRVARLDLDIEKIDAKECIIYLASNHRYNSFIKINFKKKTLKFSRRFSGLIKDAVDERKIDVNIKSGKLSLSILLDRFSVEIFVNGGKEVLSSRIYTPAEANEISFIADGEVRVDACKRDIVE